MDDEEQQNLQKRKCITRNFTLRKSKILKKINTETQEHFPKKMKISNIRKSLLRLIVLSLSVYSSLAFVSEDEEEEEEDAGEDSTSHRKETALILVTIFIVRIFIKNSRSHLFKNDDIQPISSHSRTLIHKLTQTITYRRSVFAAKALDFLEENTPEDLKPIQNAMLTEMTLMGMIGIVTFVLGKFKALNDPSEKILGEDDAINEMLEKVHMLLFFILVIFLLEASFLMFISKNRVNQWKEWNEIATEDDKLKKTLRQHAVDMADGKSVNHEKLIFLAIRQRFVFHKKAHEITRLLWILSFIDTWDLVRVRRSDISWRSISRIGHVVGSLCRVLGAHWSLKSNRDVYIVGVSLIPLLLTILNYVVLLKMSRIKEGIAPSHYLDVTKKQAVAISRRRSSQMDGQKGGSARPRLILRWVNPPNSMILFWIPRNPRMSMISRFPIRKLSYRNSRIVL